MLLRTFVLPVAACLLSFGLTWAAATPKKKAAAKAPAAKSVPAAKTTSKTAARPTAKTASSRSRYTAPARSRGTTASYSRSRARGRSPQPVAPRRYYGQQTPTQERYIEIQKALVERGYLQGEPSGTWDTDTIGAMKRFQEEQNLPPTGKVTSLSLIALGLGPKRAPLTSTTVQAQPVP
ncbi:MAG TPA: peptidoglycan-binding domain-containing protein [Bryobacteraceae bacterium]|nr:peptidoglycan-binding domain-containing protein [Bryobacteraceae bacterium]